MKKPTAYTKTIIAFALATVVLNLCALSTKFCNFYSDRVYGIINALMGTLTSWCPVAIGEIIMYLGAAVLAAWLIILIILIFKRKSRAYRHFAKGYSKAILLTLVLCLFVFTTNWFIVFKSDLIKVSENTRTTYSFEEIAEVYGIIVDNLNEISEKIERDAKGDVIYNYSDSDIAEAMKGISDKYCRLSGHYSKPKEALCSPFLDWMNIGGYNYIYTMEPTFNRYVAPLSMPILKAHEYVHHKGYYKENEGEFLSCLAMISSDNLLFQYSGYYEMYAYFSPDFTEAFADLFVAKEGELSMENLDLYKEARSKFPRISRKVAKDIERSFQMADELYNEEVPQKLEATFSEASGSIADKGWDIQGDILMDNTYDGLTLMLLQYYIDDK